jgi:hypothetical protein
MLQLFIAEIHTTYVQYSVTEQNGYFRFFFFFFVWGWCVLSFILFLFYVLHPQVKIFSLYFVGG